VLVLYVCIVMKVIETTLHRGNKGLGFTIAGRVGSQPYIESDEVCYLLTFCLEDISYLPRNFGPLMCSFFSI